MPTHIDTRQRQRAPQDGRHTINAAGDEILLHPLRNGVSVTLAFGGSASVSVSGRAVTLTAVSGTTTVAAMQTLIAGSAAASLLTLSGTSGAVFGTGYGMTSFPLWVDTVLSPSVLVTLGSDGYWWPAEADASLGVAVSLSSRIAGEDLTADRLMTLVKCNLGSGGILTASGTMHNAACVVRRLVVRETGGSSAITVVLRDGGSGGTVKTVTYVIPASGGINEQLDLAFGTDVYLSVTGTGTPSAVVYVV